MSYAIVCDSVCDLLPEEIESLNLTMVPLIVRLDGEEFEDQVDITTFEFYDRMVAAKDRPATSQPTPAKFMEVFQGVFDQGYDQIICINVAQPLSGTIESARLAVSQMEGKAIELIDCCGATASQGLITIYAAQLLNDGVPFEDAVSRIKAVVKDTKFLVACDNLDALLAGGRLSAEDAANATALNIKPIMTFDEIGVLRPEGKARGMKGVAKYYLETIQEKTEANGKQMIRFCHTGNEAEVQRLKDLLEKSGIEYVDAGTAPSGAIVATHLGMGSLGIACLPA